LGGARVPLKGDHPQFRAIRQRVADLRALIAEHSS
jgi:hypothetical protein